MSGRMKCYKLIGKWTFSLFCVVLLVSLAACQKRPEYSEQPIYSQTPALDMTEQPIPTERVTPVISIQPTNEPMPSESADSLGIEKVPSKTPEQDNIEGENTEQKHRHSFEGNQCTGCLGELAMLRTTAHETTYISGFLGSTNKNERVVRSRILCIIFCDYADTEGHYFSDLNCWDVSQAQDQSIMAWYVSHSPNQYYDVYIAPAKENIIIQAHTDASYLFANLENQVSYPTEIIGLEKVEFIKTTNMSYLFSGTKLAEDFVFDADTSNVTDISYMYQADKKTPIEGTISFGEQVDFANVTKAEGMFLNQSELAEITLPKGLAVIATDMFYGCAKLRSVDLPEKVTSIGARAFQFCGKLAEVVFPESVEEIGTEAFYQCENLLTVTLPDKLVNIGMHAFYQCKRLESVIWNGTLYTEPEVLHAALQEEGIIENNIWQ